MMKSHTEFAMIGNGPRYLRPKTWRMIEFKQVAELVDDDVFGQPLR